MAGGGHNGHGHRYSNINCRELYHLQGEGEQLPPDRDPGNLPILVSKCVASVEQSVEVALNKELEASVATFANHDSAGDNIDMEYQRFVDVTADCGMEKEIGKHHRGVSVFYQNRGVFHVVQNCPKVEENFVKALEFDCPNGMQYLSLGHSHTATVVLKEFLIPHTIILIRDKINKSCLNIGIYTNIPDC